MFVSETRLMKPKYYIDTSVFGGYFDEEFELNWQIGTLPQEMISYENEKEEGI